MGGSNSPGQSMRHPTWRSSSGQRRVLRLINRTVLEQVAELILDEAEDFGEVHLSQSSIATLLGATRHSINEALGELKKSGAFDTGYRKISLVDREALAAHV